MDVTHKDLCKLLECSTQACPFPSAVYEIKLELSHEELPLKGWVQECVQ
jgi:hypothetical protein